ncbi:diguanylate cyclase [Thermocrinis sp.]
MFYTLKTALNEKTPTVSRSETLRQTAKIIWESGRGFAIVIENDLPIGIITERDISREISNGRSLDTEVGEIMTRNLITVRWDRSVHHGLEVMLENGIRRLVLVSEEGKFVGVVSMEDLLRFMDKSALVKELRVKDILKGYPITVPHTATVKECVKRMAEENIGCLPVLNENKTLYGIITERDVVRLAAEGLLEEPVEKVATRPVITVSVESTLKEASALMEENRIRHLVVVDGERLVGVISQRDIARVLETDYREHIERKLKQVREVFNLFPECLIEALDYGDHQIVVWQNRKAEEKLGNILDRRLEELIPERDWFFVYYKLLREGKVGSFRGLDGRGIEKDGRYYEISAFYIRLDDPQVKGRVKVIIRDITQELEKQAQSVRELRLLQKVINSTEDMIIIYSAETGKFIMWNDAVKIKLGFTDPELADRTIFDINLLDREVLEENIRKIVRQGQIIKGRRFYGTAFGTKLTVDIVASKIQINGEDCILVVARDISDRIKLEEELRDKVEKLETIHDFLLNLNRCSSEGEAYNLLAHTLRSNLKVDLIVIYRINPSLNKVQNKLVYGYGNYLECLEEEPLYCKVFNSPQPFLVKNPLSYSCPLFRSEFGSYMCLPVVSSGRTIAILSLISYTEDFFTEEKIKYVWDLISVFSPFVSNLRLLEINKELSIRDPLTGLYNRRFAMEFLSKELERSKRYGKPMSIVMADLDDFKKINDTYGHAVGDICLKTFANMLSKHLRSADVAVRWGGEEFLIVLPETPKELAKEVIERIRKALKLESMSVSSACVILTASWGVASYPEDGEDLDKLLKKADDRCYLAKRGGKDTIILAE